MIDTLISERPDVITSDQVDFVDKQGFTTFGKILTDDEIIDGRFAYSRLWEANPLSEEQTQGDGVPGHPSMTMEKYCHEPALMKLIANDYALRVAAAVVHRPVTDLVYVGGYIHRQRLVSRWDYSDWFWDGWHLDDTPSLNPLAHCNIWIYFNDCTREEGVTQALVGGCELLRENIRAGKPVKERWEEGGIQDGIQALIEEVGDDPERGTWAEAPAGGGLAWGGPLWHRIAPNRSGINRQLVTYEYEPRDQVTKHDWKNKTTPQQRQAVAEMLPQDKRYLVDY